VLLEPPAASQVADKASLAQWLATAVDSDGQPGVPYREGRADWVENVPKIETEAVPHEIPVLAAAVPRRERTTPSGAKKKSGGAIAHSAAGMRFGTEVHEAFERIGWLDEETPRFSKTDGGAAVRKLVELPRIRERFQRAGRAVELHREQPVEAVIDSVWLSGTIDRLHLYRDSAGAVTRVEVIDFKTDALDDLGELVSRYAGQMEAYRQVMRLAYPGAEVDCALLSTRSGDWVAV
jgi:ATP-dependent exoDNAse (exonuclease V) beta subunit